jgi:hypothetical protein
VLGVENYDGVRLIKERKWGISFGQPSRTFWHPTSAIGSATWMPHEHSRQKVQDRGLCGLGGAVASNDEASRVESAYTIHPNSLALSLASFQAPVKNSAEVMGMRGSSLSVMSFANSPGEFFRLK